MSLTHRLEKASPLVFTLFVMAAAFCTYSCMYAFRKPYTAALFEDIPAIWGISYKSALVISQVLGYMLSKFIGIKVVSEMDGKRRAGMITSSIGMLPILC